MAKDKVKIGKKQVTFKPGQSGNPKGRAPGTGKSIAYHGEGWDVRDLARAYTPQAIETLAEVMTDQSAPPSARVSAASVMLDRGWGKAAQTIEANINHYDGRSVDELKELLASKIIELVAEPAPNAASFDGPDRDT
jgi:hypothetical protein